MSADDVRRLVGNDELSEAIDALSGSLPQSQDDLTLIRGLLAAVEQDQLRQTDTAEGIRVRRTKIGESLLHLLRPPTAAVRTLTGAELKARGVYLKDFREHVTNLLSATIHGAVLGLGVEDSPKSTNLPWRYKNSNSTQEFRSIEEAAAAYQYNLLLLGNPGGGKTTALLHIAEALIERAEKNEAAPIPLLVNLSKFRPLTPKAPLFGALFGRKPVEPAAEDAKPDHSFEEWMAHEFEELHGVKHKIARQWIEEGRVAALLDGLDEVGIERRATVAGLLNRTYLNAHRDTVTIVCSRIVEYEQLRERDESQLRLRGAVILQPLSKDQVDEYLTEAGAEGLKEALGKDRALEELSETPLTLSMMTLAYGGLRGSEILKASSAANRRHHLMESYVTRMLQRKERRDRNIPFDDDASRNVRETDYQYDPSTLNEYLSWLAIRLSVQTLTATPVTKFFSLLDRQRDAWWIRTCFAIVTAVLMLLIGLPLLPSIPNDGPELVGLTLAVVTVSLLGLRLSDFGRDAAGVVALPPLFGLALLLTSLAVVSILGWGDPAPIGMIVLTVFFSLELPAGSSKWNWLRPATIAAVIAFAIYDLHRPPDSHEQWALFFLVYLIHAGWALFVKIDWGQQFVLLLVVAFFSSLQYVGSAFVSTLTWPLVVSTIGVSLMILMDVRGLTIAAIGGLAIALAGYFGPAGVMLIAFVFSVVFVTTGYFPNVLDVWIERIILSPISRVIVPMLGKLPLNLAAMLTYAAESLLMKPFRGEIEFVHRRVRDHFALRELIPLLSSPDVPKKLQAINALGFQGASAVEPLAEVALKGSESERAAAASALGKISGPEAFDGQRAAMSDPAAEVRRAVVTSLKSRSIAEMQLIFASALNDPDRRVLEAVVESWANYISSSAEDLGEILNRDPTLLARLVDRSSTIRLGASFDLSAAHREFVSNLLTHKDPIVREKGCVLMQYNRKTVDLERLAKVFRSDRAAPVRIAAARVLAAGPGREILAAAPPDRNRKVREAVEKALSIKKVSPV